MMVMISLFSVSYFFLMNDILHPSGPNALSPSLFMTRLLVFSTKNWTFNSALYLFNLLHSILCNNLQPVTIIKGILTKTFKVLLNNLWLIWDGPIENHHIHSYPHVDRFVKEFTIVIPILQLLDLSFLPCYTFFYSYQTLKF